MIKTIRAGMAAGLAVFGVLLAARMGQAKGWDKQYAAGLPNSAFASVEELGQGQFARHLPYRDASGQIDVNHLKAALRSWKRTKWNNQANAQPALTVLKNVEQQLCTEGKMKCAQDKPKKPKAAKKPKVAKLKLPKMKKIALKKGRPAGRKPRVAAGPKPGKAIKHIARKPRSKTSAKKPEVKAA